VRMNRRLRLLIAVLAAAAFIVVTLGILQNVLTTKLSTVPHEGKYGIYIMDADGTNNHNVTPSYFPAKLLCYSPIFSKDDSKIYFIGLWS
jgi:hypothetical protein